MLESMLARHHVTAMAPLPADRFDSMCVRCIMDTSDPDITFDQDGVLSHCRAR